MNSVLVIDDDKELCELMAEYLGDEGFELDAVHDGLQGVMRTISGDYALVVLDVMLPGINGFEVLRRIRSASRIPVLMLTARGDDIDRIVGFEIGADDYLPKPFNPRELVARIRAVLRRTQPDETADKSSLGDRVLVGDIELDEGARIVKRSGETVELTAVEFDLLKILLRSAGRVVTREELAQTALGRSLSSFDRSIDMHVSHLRRKLGLGADEAERIKTVRGVGYIYARLSAPQKD